VPSLGAYGVVLVIVTAMTFVGIPVVRRIAVRVGAVVKPDERRVHERPTPTLGGVAMLAGFLVGMLVAWRMHAFDSIFDGNTEPLGLVIAAVLMLAVGAIDDLREVSPPAKVAGIVLSASVLVISGISLLSLRIPFVGTFILDPNWSYLLSVLWVLGMTNAINIIDGLDGLAAGIVAIAAGSFAAYGHKLLTSGLISTDNPSVLIAVIVVGLCLGFLPHNFHPARIFMGDGGALLLGVLMAASTMLVGGQSDESFSGQTYFFFAPLFIPLFILGVPILDTAFAIVRRARHRSGVATADKDHLHHRLMRLGHGQRRSVVILWLWTALLSAFVLYPAYTGKGDAIVPILMLALGLLLYTLFHPGRRQAREAEREGEAEREADAEREGEATDTPPEPVEGLPSSDQGLPTQVP